MITPIEIRQHQFKSKALGGYDKDEVNAFMNMLSLEVEKLLEEQRRLKAELDKTNSNLENFKRIETAIHQTLQHAEQTSKSTVENAKRDAQLKVQEGEARFRDLVSSAQKEKSRIEMEISQISSYRNDILQQLRHFLQAQTERLKSFEEREMKHTQAPQRNEPVAEPKAPENSVRAEESSIINEIADEL